MTLARGTDLSPPTQAWCGLLSLAVLLQTKLTLVVAMEAGHDMLKATGLLFAYLPGILGRTDSGVAQLWKLQAANRPHVEPWEELRRVAEHGARDVDGLWAEARLSEERFARDPLGGGGS